MTPTTADLAWLAGFLDGEGHLALTRRRADGHIQPHVSVNNTDRRAVEHVADIVEHFGGRPSVGTQVRPGHHNDVHYTNISGFRRVLDLGCGVAPHSVIKVEQWTLLLDFCRSRLYRRAIRQAHYSPLELDCAATLGALTARPRPA